MQRRGFGEMKSPRHAGGVALFCLYYACQISDPDIVRYLLIEAVKWGAPAAAILYAQIRYLDR